MLDEIFEIIFSIPEYNNNQQNKGFKINKF